MVRALRETVHKASVHRIKIVVHVLKAIALRVTDHRVTVHHSKTEARARRGIAHKATVHPIKIVARVRKVIVLKATDRRIKIVTQTVPLAPKVIVRIRTVVHARRAALHKGTVHKAALAHHSVNVRKVCPRTIDDAIIDIKRQTKQTHGLNAVSFFNHD